MCKVLIQKNNSISGSFRWENIPAFEDYILQTRTTNSGIIHYNEKDVYNFIRNHPQYAFRGKYFEKVNTNRICIKLPVFLEMLENKPLFELFISNGSIYVEYLNMEGIFKYYMYNIKESPFNILYDENKNLVRRYKVPPYYTIAKNYFARTVNPDQIYIPVTNILNKHVILHEFKPTSEDNISSNLFETGRLPGYITLKPKYSKFDNFFELVSGFKYLYQLLNLYDRDNNQVYAVIE